MGELSPMMRQYYDAKEAAKGALLLFRMGDFYELFFDDAYKAAEVLGITLTTRDRNKGPEEQTPMAGFPHQHLDSYLARLVSAGLRVAVCDQMEDPKLAKKIVRREVTRVVTPGTVMEESILNPRQSNYLAAVCIPDRRRAAKPTGPEPGRRSAAMLRLAKGADLDTSQKKQAPPIETSGYAATKREFVSELTPNQIIGLAWVELSTGHFSAMTTTYEQLLNQLARIQPAECLIQEEYRAIFPEWFLEHTTLTPRPDWVFGRKTAFETLYKRFKTASFEGFGFDERADEVALQAAGAALDYLLETQKTSLEYIDSITPYRQSIRLDVDESSRRSLEIIRSYRDGRSDGSLLGALDHCSTSLGSRLLVEWLSCPLTEIDLIEIRQDAIEEIIARADEMAPSREAFRNVCDLER
ncbi:MAG: hypothetical protein HUK22_00830, partial [Thermoguttaceae bacterium]|nr:hypothetical protein [Thermoguttaceae bacterium]